MHQSVAKPWEFTCAPFKIADHTYYVGNTWVGSFLLDSGEGLILIDCTMAQTLYQVLENIRLLGFDPHDIKKILLTHGHYDHVGGAEALHRFTNAEMWLGEEDSMFIGKPELLFSDVYSCPDLTVDRFYEDDEPVRLGRFAIHAIRTPGHTPGARSMFFYDTAGGKKVLCGMHGGLGFATMENTYLAESGWDLNLRNQFLCGLHVLKDLPVDIAIGSHPKATRMLERLDANQGKTFPLVDPSMWTWMLNDRIDAFNETYPGTVWENAYPAAADWKRLITE